METRVEWKNNMGVVVIRTDNSEKPISLIYEKINTLRKDNGDIAWFDQGLVPNVYIGKTFEIKSGDDIKSRMYEVLSILED